MSEKHGVKETKEAVLAIAAIGAFVAERLKDGADLSDLGALVEKLKDEKFAALVKAGVEGIDLVDDEVKDLSLAEGIELAGALLPELLVILASTKKEKAA